MTDEDDWKSPMAGHPSTQCTLGQHPDSPDPPRHHEGDHDQLGQASSIYICTVHTYLSSSNDVAVGLAGGRSDCSHAFHFNTPSSPPPPPLHRHPASNSPPPPTLKTSQRSVDGGCRIFLLSFFQVDFIVSILFTSSSIIHVAVCK